MILVNIKTIELHSLLPTIHSYIIIHTYINASRGSEALKKRLTLTLVKLSAPSC